MSSIDDTKEDSPEPPYQPLGWSCVIRIAELFTLKVLQVGEPLEVLSTVVALQDVAAIDIQHRISCAWRKVCL